MQNNYIVRTKNNTLLSFFYTQEKSIFYKFFEDENWSSPRLVIQNVREYFTVNMANNGELYLFCQNDFGDIILCRAEKDEWQSKMILKNQSQKLHDILFNAVIDDENMKLIYNINTEKKSDILVFQNMSQKGKWDDSKKVDEMNFYDDVDFQVHKVNSDKAIVLYHKLAGEFQIGYREIEKDGYSDFNVFHKTTYKFIDYSCLPTSETIHLLYVVKAMFSTQVIYRKKDITGISMPIVLFENQSISACSLAIVKNTIYASWVSNRQLFYSTCKVNSDVFSRPVKDNNFSSVNSAKAFYISYQSMKENEFICTEVFVNNKNSSDVLFLPEIYPEFYSVRKTVDKPQRNEERIGNPNEQISNTDRQPSNTNRQPSNINMQSGNINGQNVRVIDDLNDPSSNLNVESFDRLRNQVHLAQNQANEKDKQIISLTNIIQNKNSEMLDIEKNYARRIKTLNEEIERLSKTNELLIQNIKSSKEDGPVKEEMRKEEVRTEEPVEVESVKEEPIKEETVKEKPVEEEIAKEEPVKDGEGKDED